MGFPTTSSSHSGFLVVVLVICVQVLFLLPHKPYALRSRDFVLGQHQNRHLFAKSAPALPRPDMLSDEGGLAPILPSAVKFDPNQSEKRRVPRGSDPIHNRCWRCLLPESEKSYQDRPKAWDGRKSREGVSALDLSRECPHSIITRICKKKKKEESYGDQLNTLRRKVDVWS